MAATGIATGIATDMAKGIASATIRAVIKQIKDVVELDQSLQLLNTDFGYMNSMLLDIDQQFQAQQRRLPVPIEASLTRMSDALNEGQQLISSADRQRRRCFGCCLLCNRNLFTQIRDWRTRFEKRFQEFVNVFSVAANTQHIVSSAPSQPELLLQDVPDVIVGSAIESAQVKLQAWLTEPAHSQARVIGIYGMGGVGKTSVLKVIHNNYKEKVSGIFDFVIWHTVSMYKSEAEDDKIKELQFSIAHQLHLDLKDCPTLDIRKMKLYASLENSRFLLILDDLWSPIDLNKVGIKFGRDKGSKLLISSRSRDVIKTMAASDHYSLRMEPLSAEQGWELFSRKAFANGVAPGKEIETTAEEIARECKGLPLALNVVAAALFSETDISKWRNALQFMRNVDPTFPDTHSTIDKDLYQRLRWSYNDLPNHLKSCFLYCAAFPEDAEIEVETLLEMWSAEGFVIRRGMTQLLDAGRQYVDALVSRCLIEYVGLKSIWVSTGEDIETNVYREVIRVHDVLRDMAIYIGERDEDWVFASAQHLQQFPRGEVTRNCKRLSVSHNDIEELPTDLECTTELLCLVLANCNKLTKVPAESFSNITSLKVLDLSCTLIKSLPTSVGQLGELQFLNLTGCYLLKELPESICGLSRLQFLNLQFCESLVSLPDNIGDLQSLKHLNFDTLDVENRSTGYVQDANARRDDAQGDDVVEDTAMIDFLPPLQNMNDLRSLHLYEYPGRSLPSYVRKLPHLEELCIGQFSNVKEVGYMVLPVG
eukprot:PITA_01156